MEKMEFDDFMQLYPFDYKERICQEVDKEEDLMDVRKKLGLN